MEPRTSISTASRSTRPVLRQAPKATPGMRVTSSLTSCWIASAVFFLRRERVLDRAYAANLLIDIHKVTAQLLVVAKGGDLMLGLALSGWAGKAFRHRLALPFVSQTQVRAVAWVIGPMTVTAGTSAPAASAGDRTRAQIGQLGNLLQQRRTLLFQSGNSIGHWCCLTQRILYPR